MVGRYHVLVFALGAILASLSADNAVNVCAAEPATNAESKPAKTTPAADDLFATPHRIWEFHLEVSPADWEKMQPVGGMRFPGAPAGDQPAAVPVDSHRSSFGMQFPWVRATFSDGDKVYQDVGLRYKGNGSYMASARSLKRNLKVDFDHYNEDQSYLGHEKLNLNSGAADPSKLRESLAYALFHQAGVPSPRTTFAKVTLTVPGKYDKELLGIYTIVEQVDKPFLKQHFTKGKSLLLKPERMRGLDYLGDDWAKYKDQYNPEREPTVGEANRLIEFARLVNTANDEKFNEEIGKYLDLDQFLRFLAVNTLIANMDSLFSTGHNFYIYLDPRTSKFVFLPWDLDLSFAGFGVMGSPEQQLDLSLVHPHMGEHKLIDRVLASPDRREAYLKVVKQLSESVFAKEKLLAEIEEVEKATAELVAADKQAYEARQEQPSGFGPPGSGLGAAMRSPDLRTFVEKRTASVADQLSGKSKGQTLAGGFGFGGPGGGMGGFWARPLLEALDVDKSGNVSKVELVAGSEKFFALADKQNAGHLNPQTLGDGINAIVPRPPGFGPGGPGGGPGRGGPGFGPGPGGNAAPGNAAQPGGGAAAGEVKDAPKKDAAAKDAPATATQPGAAGPPSEAAALKTAPTGAPGAGPTPDGPPGRGVGGPGGPISPRPGQGPGRPGGRIGGPGGFNLGSMVAPVIFKRADADGDGNLTLGELTATAEAIFVECDKDKNGTLDDKELGAGVNLLMPPPPQFGPPGGRPGQPGGPTPPDRLDQSGPAKAEPPAEPAKP